MSNGSLSDIRFTFWRRIFLGIWITVITGLLIWYIINPLVFTPQAISQFLLNFQSHLWITYGIVTFLRGFFLIPSTPFVLTGIIIFPDFPFWVLALSMSGVLFSATMLYYFPEYLGVDRYLDRKYSERMKVVRKKANDPRAFWFVLGWSIFPLVPTDLICNIAGTIRMRYLTMLSGVFLGEGILNTFYVYGGAQLIERL
ncbi:MAG: hypothetical protein GF372_01040 [Candidatus Marinimicrobia bacterium]|nr:hypothetical protein [Candidatus Neomarinimicrobiota bacterium]